MLSPEEIEKLRNVGLKIHSDGSMTQKGEFVTHPRLKKAILSWLDVVDGRVVVAIDETRFAYVEVEKYPLIVVSCFLVDGELVVKLNSENTKKVNLEKLLYDEEDEVFLFEVKKGLIAKFSQKAQGTLLSYCNVSETGQLLLLGCSIRKR